MKPRQTVVEARAALPLDGGVKADSPHGQKTEGTVPCLRGETG